MFHNYELLARHFAQETSVQEEAIIDQYKANNPEEYQKLYELWSSKLAEVKDLDSAKAWERVKAASRPEQKPKIRSLRWISYAAAILLVVFAVTQILPDGEAVEELHWVSNDTERLMNIILPDSTEVILASNARLGYPVLFDGEERKLESNGKLFFDVVRDTLRPFIINTNNATVKVLGTSFSVEDHGETTAVNVATGLVQVSPLSSKESVFLKAGEMAIASKSQVDKSTIVDNYFASKYTGRFDFDHIPIEEVVDQLNQYYSVAIELEVNDSQCHLTSVFNGTPIEDVVEILCRTCNLKSIKTNSGYVLQ